MIAFKEAQLSQATVAKLEAHAGAYWDAFYRQHATKFFSDRHWFPVEFPALLTAAAVLEVGCGVGNTVFPVLQINHGAHVYACDYAPTAVDHVKAHPAYTASGRVTAFVADITRDNLIDNVPQGTIDVCTMVFVLSAVSPDTMAAAVANVARTLVPGSGRVMFRDYAAGDLAQERLAENGRQQRIGEGFYMRGDGTRAFYFQEDTVRRLFEEAGFRCDSLTTIDRLKVNRATGLAMDRRFAQGEFTLLRPEAAATVPLAAEAVVEEECGNSSITNGGLETAAEMVELGPMRLEVQRPGGPAARALARAVLACPALFLGANVVQVRCGAGALPALAALRWCRRALAADRRQDEIETLRRNVLANGALFAFERLRLAREPADAAPGWAAAAFQGSDDVCMAAIEENDPSGALKDVMESFERSLARVVVLVGPRQVVEAAAVAAAERHGLLQPCSPPQAACGVFGGGVLGGFSALWLQRRE